MLQIFKYPKPLFISLLIAFIVFNTIIYSIPTYSTIKNPSNIAEGKMVWQKNNCHTCHQLYGLGGYLGPDLTNVLSKPGYSPDYIKGIIKGGVKQMPAFNLSENELNDLLLFLTAANTSGSANPNNYDITYLGTFTAKKK